jgi:hypothetical protein
MLGTGAVRVVLQCCALLRTTRGGGRRASGCTAIPLSSSPTVTLGGMDVHEVNAGQAASPLRLVHQRQTQPLGSSSTTASASLATSATRDAPP